MKFGLLLHTQGHTDETSGMFEHVVEQAELAEECGWDLALAGQHFAPDPYAMLQPIPLLGHLAARTDRLLLGTAVVLAAHLKPIQVAEDLVTLDHLSGGRLIAGVGAGYRRIERQLFDVPGQDWGERFERHVRELMALLRGGQITVGDGPDAQSVELTLPSLQQPAPPVWMAASSSTALARVARLGATWFTNPHVPTDQLVRHATAFREAPGSSHPGGRQIAVFREGVIAEEPDRAAATLAAHVIPKYQQYAEWGLPGMRAGSGSEAVLRDTDRFVTGDPESCLRQVETLAEMLEPEALVLRMQWPGMRRADALEAIELFGRSVIRPFKLKHGLTATTQL